MRSYLLRESDRFMAAVDRGSKVLGWVAVILAFIFIILPALVQIWMK